MSTPPVLILAYRRPREFRQVLAAVLQQERRNVYVFCDGPTDAEGVKIQDEIRSIVASVPLVVPVKSRFLETNLGLRVAVITALDWIFEQEECVIVLEDDVLPTSQFFLFCEKGLKLYRKEPMIQQISGYNPLGNLMALLNPFGTHLLNTRMDCWGWATWADRWAEFRTGSFESLNLEGKSTPSKWLDEITQGHQLSESGALDSWAYSWALFALKKQNLALVPRVNMTLNIGFGASATHTKKGKSARSFEYRRVDRFPQTFKPSKAFISFAYASSQLDQIWRRLARFVRFASRIGNSLKRRAHSLFLRV